MDMQQFWLAVQHSVKSTTSWLVYIEVNEKTTSNIDMAYYSLPFYIFVICHVQRYPKRAGMSRSLAKKQLSLNSFTHRAYNN